MDSTELREQGSPELIEEIEFRDVTDQSLFVGKEIGVGNVAVGVHWWVGWS